MSRRKSQDDYHGIIRALSGRIVEAQTPIRVLDAIKWDDSIRQGFLKAKGKEIGLAEGEAKEKLATAKRLFSMGLSVQDIAKATSLPIEQVEALQAEQT